MLFLGCHAKYEVHSGYISGPTCMAVSKNSNEQESCSTYNENQTPVTVWEPDILRQKQLEDLDIMPILRSVESGIKSRWADIAGLSSIGKTL
ncbi:hypothetical protein DPMN_052917 [Dreissena polymorpha]|uniref:Uncharacterized protein n=1 Tax=Dreissena polymorpha TaxID=45954 RepID=A0A9D4CKF1_DREPO|nr:hypothetical protein DPMN_052917 [Dreissena polymorpha]